MKIPEILYKFASHFHEKGFQCYLVGGATRDTLLGKGIKDFDVTTDAQPKEVMKIFRRVIPTGIKHGTVTVLYKKDSIEVTTFRIDGKYEDMRRPEEVTFTPSLKEDLSRRDFTINAIAYDLTDRSLTDPFEGREDLKRKTIRAIGVPEERFNEDGLRLMRACRFAAQLDFKIEEKTFEGIKKTHTNLRLISAERIRDELDKILLSPNPVYGLELLEETGLLEIILPELTACREISQRWRHGFDVFYHSLYACEGARADSLELRLAALLHDIGKARTIGTNEAGENTFYSHEIVSAKMAEEILDRLRYSNQFKKTVIHLIRHHMFNYTPEWTDSAVRRFISRVGKSAIKPLIELRMADKYGMKRETFGMGDLEEFLKRIDSVLSKENALTIKDLALNGGDLIKELGIKPGKTVGTLLDFLLESVLDDPALNNREKLLEMGANFYKERLLIPENHEKNNMV